MVSLSSLIYVINNKRHFPTYTFTESLCVYLPYSIAATTLVPVPGNDGATLKEASGPEHIFALAVMMSTM